MATELNRGIIGTGNIAKKFPGDILAQLATGVRLNQDNVLQVFGTEGNILVPWPWIPAREGGTSRIVLSRQGDKAPEEILVSTEEHLYAIEADTVARDLDRRQAAWPAMSWDDTLGNMKTMDLWRQSIGLTYDLERIA